MRIDNSCPYAHRHSYPLARGDCHALPVTHGYADAHAETHLHAETHPRTDVPGGGPQPGIPAPAHG